MSEVGIQTTQNVVIDYEIASIGDRIVATLLDYVVFLAYIFLIMLFAAATDGFGNNIAVMIILFIPFFFYDLVCETFIQGQSVGKIIMKIKVVKMKGTRPNFGNYLVRWLFRLIDTMFFSGVVALVTILINGKGQRLGDIAAGTTVIKLSKQVALKDTILEQVEPGYVTRFPEVTVLTDRDIGIIKDVLAVCRRTNNFEALKKLADKTRDTMGVTSEIPDIQFLETVIKDYNNYHFDR